MWQFIKYIVNAMLPPLQSMMFWVLTWLIRPFDIRFYRPDRLDCGMMMMIGYRIVVVGCMMNNWWLLITARLDEQSKQHQHQVLVLLTVGIVCVLCYHHYHRFIIIASRVFGYLQYNCRCRYLEMFVSVGAFIAGGRPTTSQQRWRSWMTIGGRTNEVKPMEWNSDFDNLVE